MTKLATSTLLPLLLLAPVVATAQIAQPTASTDPTAASSAAPVEPGQGIPPLSEVATSRGQSQANLEAYLQALEEGLPMTPEMITTLRELVDASQRAAAYPPEGPPTGTLDAVAVDLTPGGPPPKISVAARTASVVNFFDATGAAWPITGYVVGDPKSFQILTIGEEASFLTVTPLVQHGYSNLVVRLQNLDTPIVIEILTDPQVINYRRDIRIAAYGPKAGPEGSIAELGPNPGDLTLVTFLTGADLPKEAKAISIQGAAAQAWLYADSLYLRGTDALLSPAWDGSLAGPGELRVYRLKPSPILLMSIAGQPTTVRAILP
jgi:intracellular multiplication protein IcmK